MRNFSSGTDSVAITQYAGINSIDQLTVSVWLNRQGSGGGGLGRIFDKFHGTGNGLGHCFVDHANAKTVFTEVRHGTTGGQWSVAHSATSTLYHLLIRYDYGSTSNDPVISVNGTNLTVTEEITPAGTLQADTKDLRIGNRSDNARVFNGYIGEFAMWNRILADAERDKLAALYSALFMPSGLVGYWKLVGNASPEPNFSPSGGNTGTVTGTTAQTHPAIIYPTGGPFIGPFGKVFHGVFA